MWMLPRSIHIFQSKSKPNSSCSKRNALKDYLINELSFRGAIHAWRNYWCLVSNVPYKGPRFRWIAYYFFFQKHWQIFQSGLVTTWLHILNEQGNPAPLNHTYIALVPNIAKPRKVTDYRPINLCNVVYKIVDKAIVNRMKPIISWIISQIRVHLYQISSLQTMLLLVMNVSMKYRYSRRKKNGLVALKLDISKAYDRVEWQFLEQTMVKLGFSNMWVSLIMRCITTVAFLIIINGVAKGLVQPKRDLR